MPVSDWFSSRTDGTSGQRTICGFTEPLLTSERCSGSHRGREQTWRGDLDLVARFEELARSVADTLDAAAPRGPAAPFWLALDREAYLAELAKLRHWADTVLRQH